MQWTQVSANDNPIWGNLPNTIEAFARGEVQSKLVQLVRVSGSADSHSHSAQMSELGDFALTSKLCLSAIYAVGGSECTVADDIDALRFIYDGRGKAARC